MSQTRALASPTPDHDDRAQVRWNPQLSKAFDVSREQFPPRSAEEALVSKYLGVEIKHLERRVIRVPSVRMGAFLTAAEIVLRNWSVDDVRNLNWEGKETTPLYDVIQLNSSQSQDFLIDGMRFIRQGDNVKATLRVEPRWYGLDVTTYGLRSLGTADTVLSEISSRSKDINFLKGEAFALSGEFLPRTAETFSDLFIEPVNAQAMTRVVSLINSKGKALDNRGVLLMGPPGTGKTLSARIVRNVAQATFIWVSARDFHYAGSFGGFTEAFDLARECSPSVVVFEDVDNWLSERTVDLLKTEMDGVSQSTGVVTMMTTNFPELLPAALIDRPGRFHDVLRFGLPDATARRQMLMRWLPGLDDKDLVKAVEATAGYSGAHVRELARFASIIGEQENLPLPKALAAALAKLAEQRDLISETQRAGSRYRMPQALVSKSAVRIDRPADFAEKGDSIAKMHRVFSDLEFKSINETGRRFKGIATTPKPDRVGDIVEPLGIEFKNPMPLLLFHDGSVPVGEVTFGSATSHGIPFEAVIPEVVEPGIVRDLTDKAAHLVKYRLVKSVSIGFRSLSGAVESIANGGLKFLKTEVMELSLVSIPANPDALIHSVKSIGAKSPAATGTKGTVSLRTVSTKLPGASGSVTAARAAPRTGAMAKTYTEQIAAFEATRAAKSARIEEIQTKASDEGRTKDESEKEEFGTLRDEIKQIDDELVDLREMEALSRSAAKVVSGTTPAAAAVSRDPQRHSVITVKDTLPPGIEYTRMVMCKAAAFVEMQKGNMVSAIDIAKERYPDHPRIQRVLKATVPAATTSDAAWAGPLVDAQTLESEFVEFLRPQTILGKFGTNGIPSLRRVPFNIRFTGQTSGGNGYWVGQGKPKPLTSFAFEATTLTWAKIAAISVLTEETVRFSSPNAETLTRDGLMAAIVERSDIDFTDPAHAAVSNVNPASITNGLTALTSAGTSADNVRTDLLALLSEFVANNNKVTDVVLIMPDTLALALSLMVNSLGQDEFPNVGPGGGRLRGLPVITSQYVANASGSGNMVIAVNAREIFLADDGQVNVDVSREASLEMSDGPSQDGAAGTGASLVSLWQNNMIGLRAERFINWAKRRAEAVVYMDDVNWGSVGSPS